MLLLVVVVVWVLFSLSLLSLVLLPGVVMVVVVVWCSISSCSCSWFLFFSSRVVPLEASLSPPRVRRAYARQVSHGGTEMGQGLHTKVMQIVAQRLGVSLDRVNVLETASDKVANTSPTAASMSTDLYGMAALDACDQILARLEPIRLRRLAAREPVDLAALANEAFFARVDTSAHGFYAVDDARCGYDWSQPERDRGHPFNYFTQGAACCEVEIDVLTGDWSTVRADVLVDVGCSVNPARSTARGHTGKGAVLRIFYT